MDYNCPDCGSDFINYTGTAVVDDGIGEDEVICCVCCDCGFRFYVLCGEV